MKRIYYSSYSETEAESFAELAKNAFSNFEIDFFKVFNYRFDDNLTWKKFSSFEDALKGACKEMKTHHRQNNAYPNVMIVEYSLSDDQFKNFTEGKWIRTNNCRAWYYIYMDEKWKEFPRAFL